MTSGNQSSDFGRRYQTLPSSAVVRPLPARRARATIASNSPQICEESVYPVFNPLDPRHNPTAPASSWFDDTYFPPGAPSSPGSEGWMQSLSKRSMRKARSGLQALRSGMQRRPLVDGFRRNGWPEEYSDQKENIFPSTVSEASTEEDTEFGSHLHRTKCKSSPLTRGQDRPVPMSRFSSALAELSPFARRSGEQPDLPTLDITGSVLNEHLHESGNENAEQSAISESPSVNCDIEPRDRLAAGMATQSSADSSRPSSLPRDSACSDLSVVIAAGTAGLAQTSSGIDGLEIDHVDKSMAYPRCVQHPSLDSNSPEPSNHPAHPEEAQKVIRAEDSVLPVPAQESNVTEMNDIDLMMDTLGALDRLCIQESPNMGRTDPGSTESSPGSPRRSRSSNSGRESCRSSGEGQSNRSCNIRIQVQSGDWSRTLSPVPESTDLVDSNDFFGDQAAWSNRPSEEGTTTDITSVSNALWSPVGNEDLTSLASMGDEYFLVDGKTSGFHPDRGGNPTKAERRLISDDSLYSDPSLERNPSVLTQEIPEVIGPGSPMRMPPSASRPRDRDASDSTDEYLVTYPLFLKRYLS